MKRIGQCTLVVILYIALVWTVGNMAVSSVAEPEAELQTVSDATRSPIVQQLMDAQTLPELEVHFIDVGQGDATLIKTEEHAMLIDAGGNTKGTAVQLYLKKQGVEQLDYLVMTHSDADHIGGADVIITKYDIGTVFMGDYEKDNHTYEEVQDALQYRSLSAVMPEVGDSYQLGEASFTILAPNRNYDDSNNGSIALLLQHGENSFLFTGDCKEEAELDILNNGLEIDCDVYKLGHHGSSTSSSKEFLKKISPQYGVVSCAEGNTYGFPHAASMNELRSMDVKLFRTDLQGSVVAYSDGKEITWNCAPEERWLTGDALRESAGVTVGALIKEPAATDKSAVTTGQPVTEGTSYVCNSNPDSMRFHKPDCMSVELMNPANRLEVQWTREEAISNGYKPCKNCNP